MRRPLNIILGVLEVLVAVVLAAFVLQLPDSDEVMDKVGRLEAVGQQSGKQVKGLRDQIGKVRKRQPPARQLAIELRDRLNVQQRDYERAMEELANALAKTSTSIDTVTTQLDGTRLDHFATGLAVSADLLDKRIAPTATVMGSRLEQSSRGLRGDVRRLSNLWDEAPPDVQFARSTSQLLGQFDEGLAAMSERLDGNRVQALMLELRGMELSLLAAAENAERLSSMTNPLEAFSFRRDNKPKTIWPEGKQTATRLRTLAAGIQESERELLAKAQLLPALRAWIDASRASTADVRRDLANGIQRRLSDDPRWRNTPLHLASMAEDVLAVGEEIGRLLHDTNQLRDLANRLRQVHDGTLEAEKGIQQLRISLSASVDLLKGLEADLRQGSLRTSIGQTLIVFSDFIASLPMLTDSLDNGLEEQDQALGRLQGSVEQLTVTIPDTGRRAARLIQMSRLLMFLIGAICLIHGAFLLVANLIPYQRVTLPATMSLVHTHQEQT